MKGLPFALVQMPVVLVAASGKLQNFSRFSGLTFTVSDLYFISFDATFVPSIKLKKKSQPVDTIIL